MFKNWVAEIPLIFYFCNIKFLISYIVCLFHLCNNYIYYSAYFVLVFLFLKSFMSLSIGKKTSIVVEIAFCSYLPWYFGKKSWLLIVAYK